MKCQQKLTAAWCFLWSVKSIAVPHRQSCCLACSHIVGLQTRLIANKVPCFQATYLPELNTSAAFVQPYLSSSVAGIRSAEMERGCHCIFGLNTTHLHGTLTDSSKLQLLSLFLPFDSKKPFISLLWKISSPSSVSKTSVIQMTLPWGELLHRVLLHSCSFVWSQKWSVGLVPSTSSTELLESHIKWLCNMTVFILTLCTLLTRLKDSAWRLVCFFAVSDVGF